MESKQNRLLQTMLVSYLIFWCWMAVSPYDPFHWWLENVLVFFFLAILIVTYRFFQFSQLSYIMIALFFFLHTYGAHYSYSTPVDPWMRDVFGFQRDSYDRIVHFCFGLLIVLPIQEMLWKIVQIGRGWSYSFAVMVVLAAGAFYELIEMWVVFLVAPEVGTMFIGVQGDPWDAQHDIELAMYGSVLTMSLAWFIRLITGKRQRSKESR